MAGIPSKIKPSGFRGGAFMGGASGSGPGRAMYDTEKAAQPGMNPAAEKAQRGAKPNTAGVSGSGNPTDQWVGKGADKRYVQVPKANTDRNRVSTPASTTETNRRNAADGVNAGASRGAPTRSPKAATAPKDQGDSRGTPTQTTSTTSKSGGSAKASTSTSSSAGKASGGEKPKKSAPAVPGTLNYFMQMTMKDGKKNARNRAYQMFKNYKKSGKLPGDMGSATQ